MNNIKKYGSLFMFIVNCLTLIGYTIAVVYNMFPIEPYKWIVTSIFAIFFLKSFINCLKNKHE
jgi:hypothetical protein